MIEVITDTNAVQVNYTVRGPRDQIMGWLRDLYLTYPVGAYATSHSEPREDRGQFVTFVSRFAQNS